jgi:hypothetical protein
LLVEIVDSCMLHKLYIFSEPQNINIIPKQLKDLGPISLSTFKNNIYFWDFLVWQKCSRNSKLDKKNVQFLKTGGLYQNENFPKVNLHHNAHNTNIFIENVLP